MREREREGGGGEREGGGRERERERGERERERGGFYLEHAYNFCTMDMYLPLIYAMGLVHD